MAWFLTVRHDLRRPEAALAVKLAKRAVELAPKNGNYWNTLGVAQYRDGAWEDARISLSKAVELGQGGSAFDFFFLAMSHWQLGEKDKARDWYGKAVQWMDKNKPQDEELRRFRTETATLLGIKEPHPTKESPTPKP
jgi:Flp pilus assembly protein TadD